MKRAGGEREVINETGLGFALGDGDHEMPCLFYLVCAFKSAGDAGAFALDFILKRGRGGGKGSVREIKMI